MTVKVEAVSESRVLGEGPHWDHERQHLYYVDAFKAEVHRYIPAENRHTFCKINGKIISIVIPVKGKNDKFLVAVDETLTVITWDGESTKPQNAEVIAKVEERDNLPIRFNDAKVDPTGLLWIGTLSHDMTKNEFNKGAGSLYSFSKKDKKLVEHLDGLTIANGLAWSSDLKNMYYIDTPTKRVDVFDYNSKEGKISNRRMLADFSKFEGHGPDGQAIDTDGNLWVAVFGGSGVYNVNAKTGEIIRKIDVPSLQTTSVAFGGPNLDELYVVSAKFNYTEEELKKYPQGGCTFRITGLGVKGYPGLPIDL